MYVIFKRDICKPTDEKVFTLVCEVKTRNQAKMKAKEIEATHKDIAVVVKTRHLKMLMKNKLI